MSALVKKAISTVRSDGPISFMKQAWQWAWRTALRPVFPGTRTLYYNNVQVPVQTNPLDNYLPFVEPPEQRPNFESGLISALERTVSERDTVITLGGGWGVTAVRAGELVGESGTVIVYEGAADAVEKVKETARLNSVEDRIKIIHAIVGPDVDLMHGGDSTDAGRVDPADLPACDVLEMDIEGSEIEVIRGLDLRPEWILVETHGWKGAPTEEVRTALKAKGYEILEKEIADCDRSKMCREKDIHILTARTS